MNDELNPQAPQTPQDNPEKDPEDWVTGDELQAASGRGTGHGG
jgi:hypothetical protein